MTIKRVTDLCLPQNVSKVGIIEIFQTSDEAYYEVFCDGEHVVSVSRDYSMNLNVVKRSSVEAYKRISGIEDVDSLTFVVVRLSDILFEAGVEFYLEDDYEEYLTSVKEFGEKEFVKACKPKHILQVRDFTSMEECE